MFTLHGASPQHTQLLRTVCSRDDRWGGAPCSTGCSRCTAADDNARRTDRACNRSAAHAGGATRTSSRDGAAAASVCASRVCSSLRKHAGWLAGTI